MGRHVGAGFGRSRTYLTAYRDFHDHCGRKILLAMGHSGAPGIFVRTERWALVVVLIAPGLLNLVRSHRSAIVLVYALILTGFGALAGVALAYRAVRLDSVGWLAAAGAARTVVGGMSVWRRLS